MDAEAKAVPSIDDVRSRAPKISQSALDYGLLAERTGFSVKLVWILGYSLLQKAFGDPGLTPLRVSMLELAGCNPGAQQIQLGAALGLSRSAATLSIDFWEERGCVERRTDPADRRSFGIYLTDHGRSELTRLREVVRRADEALTASLEPEEVIELRRLLAKIHR